MTEMKNKSASIPMGHPEGRYYDVDGKQHSLYGRTKAIVKDKLASKRAEIVSGNSITETDLTIEQSGWEWMQTFKAGKIKHSTMDNYESDFRMHVVPYIGHIKLKDLTTLHIQRTYTKAQQNGLSPKSIRNIHGLVHGMLAKAQSLGHGSQERVRGLRNCPCWKRLRCTRSLMWNCVAFWQSPRMIRSI